MISGNFLPSYFCSCYFFCSKSSLEYLSRRPPHHSSSPTWWNITHYPSRATLNITTFTWPFQQIESLPSFISHYPWFVTILNLIVFVPFESLCFSHSWDISYPPWQMKSSDVGRMYQGWTVCVTLQLYYIGNSRSDNNMWHNDNFLKALY